MPTYLQRYSSGEHEQVWAELVALGSAVEQAPLYADAMAVARETMTRVRKNAELVVSRLQMLDYVFEYPDHILMEPVSDVQKQLSQLEHYAGGRIPLALQAFYEIVGAIDWIGDHPRLASYHNAEFLPVGYTIYGDPLVVYPIQVSSTELTWVEDDEYISWDDGYSIEFAPDVYHKANVSGGESYRISVGATFVADTLVLAEPHNTTFVNYLRAAFRWGGFPGLENDPLDDETKADIVLLTEGLVAF